MKKLVASLLFLALGGMAYAGYTSESLSGTGFTGHSFSTTGTTTLSATSYGSGSAQIHGNGVNLVSYGQGYKGATGTAGNYYMYCVGNSPYDSSSTTASW